MASIEISAQKGQGKTSLVVFAANGLATAPASGILPCRVLYLCYEGRSPDHLVKFHPNVDAIEFKPNTLDSIVRNCSCRGYAYVFCDHFDELSPKDVLALDKIQKCIQDEHHLIVTVVRVITSN